MSDENAVTAANAIEVNAAYWLALNAPGEYCQSAVFVPVVVVMVVAFLSYVCSFLCPLDLPTLFTPVDTFITPNLSVSELQTCKPVNGVHHVSSRGPR